jgi:hypothetical protein
MAFSNLSDFVTAAADGAHTKLTINHNGTGSGNSVTIILKNVAYTTSVSLPPKPCSVVFLAVVLSVLA